MISIEQYMYIMYFKGIDNRLLCIRNLEGTY